MSEAPKHTNGWTLKTLYIHFLKVIEDLRNYLDQRFNDNDKAVQAALLAQEKAVAAALEAAKEAVNKADEADQKHFETINERNREIDKLTSTFIPRTEYEVQHKSLEDKVDLNAKAVADLRSRLDVGNPAIAALQTQEASRKGQQQGADITKSDFYRALTLAVAALTALISAVILLVHFA